MRKINHCLLLFLILMFHACSSKEPVAIDRQSLVERHTVFSDSLDVKSPAQVGNGEFAFAVDITGLQTFVPFNTMSHWGWHSDPVPGGMKVEDFRVNWLIHGADLLNIHLSMIVMKNRKLYQTGFQEILTG